MDEITLQAALPPYSVVMVPTYEFTIEWGNFINRNEAPEYSTANNATKKPAG